MLPLAPSARVRQDRAVDGKRRSHQHFRHSPDATCCFSRHLPLSRRMDACIYAEDDSLKCWSALEDDF